MKERLLRRTCELAPRILGRPALQLTSPALNPDDNFGRWRRGAIARAGATAQQAIGRGHIGGTLTRALVEGYFVPVFIVQIKRIFGQDSTKFHAQRQL